MKEGAFFMAKKGFGKFIAAAAAIGAVAAGISYFTRYKSFHKELEEDFHTFEDDDDDETLSESDTRPTPAERTYVSLNAGKDEFKEAAKDAKEAVADMAEAAKDMMKDGAELIAENAKNVTEAVADKVEEQAEKLAEKAEKLAESTTIIEEE